jgi:hypothetical protein
VGSTIHPAVMRVLRRSGGFGSTPPDAAVMRRSTVGCFPGDRAPFMHHGPPLYLSGADWSIRTRLVGKPTCSNSNDHLASTGTTRLYRPTPGAGRPDLRIYGKAGA